LAGLYLAISDFLDPNKGPEQGGDFRISPAFFFVVFGIGFLMGALGHVMKVKALVAAGVLLIMLATFVLPVALHLTK
jgi:hypothetical protein